jgi:hypothetical protein
VYRLETGNRTLSDSEFSSVLAALAQVKIERRNMCGADGGVTKLDLVVDGTTLGYVDDFYGCRAAPEGRTFVSFGSLEQLETVLFGLTQA